MKPISLSLLFRILLSNRFKNSVFIVFIVFIVFNSLILWTITSTSELHAQVSASSQQRQEDSSDPAGTEIKEEAVPVSVGRLSDTLYAILPGIIIHGSGHYSQGDENAASSILAFELIGATWLAGGLVINSYADPNIRIYSLASDWLTHFGSALLMTTWLTDLIGSFQGNLSAQFQNQRYDLRHVYLGYRYHSDPQKLMNHHLIAGINYELKRWRFSGGINWEADGELIGVDAEALGAFFIYQTRAHSISSLNLGVRVRRWAWQSEDLTQLLLLPFLEGQLSLDQISKGLNGFSFFHRIGLGWELFELASHPDDQGKSQIIDFPLVLESGLKLRPYRDIRLSFSVIQDHTLDQQPFQDLDLFIRSTLNYRQNERVDLNVSALWGQEWSTWISVAFRLGRAP